MSSIVVSASWRQLGCRKSIGGILFQFLDTLGGRSATGEASFMCRHKASLRKLKKAPEVLRNSPKKPLTPFLMFTEEVRSRIQTEHPGLPMKEIVKKISQEYHQLDMAMKEAYFARYQAQMQEFRVTWATYYGSLSDDEKFELAEFKAKHREKTLQKKKRSQYRALNPPKRPIGAFNWFVKDYIAAKSPDKFGPAAMVEAGQKWREMSDIEKQPYREKATSDAVRYQQEISDFRVLHGIGSVTLADIEKPKPAFALYLSSQIQSGAISKEGKLMVDVAREARHKWIAMTEDERKPFEVKATQEQKKYEDKLEDHRKNLALKKSRLVESN